MANQWLRLWHDMPNDPKWRTISRLSKQSIGNVLAVYLHLLTSASQNVTRGHVDVTVEDLASAIDVTEDVINDILNAMEGRVIDVNKLTGWEKRQPKREDSGNEESGAKSSAERKRKQRERDKESAKTSLTTDCHDESHNVTIDKDKDKDKELLTLPNGSVCDLPGQPTQTVIKAPPIPTKPDCPHKEIIALYHEILPSCPSIRDWTPSRATALRTRWSEKTKHQNLEYWRGLFEYIASIPFLIGQKTGRDGRVFFASLDWIVKAENFAKIREGRYQEQAA